jgi:hypothetical protein
MTDEFDADEVLRDLQRPTIVLTTSGHAYSVRNVFCEVTTAAQIFDSALYQTEKGLSGTGN